MTMPKERKLGRHRVVITGLGAVSPLGSSVNEFWTGLVAGKSGVAVITDIDLSNCRTRIGAHVVGYEPGQHFSPRALQRLSLPSQLALVAAREAIKDADLDVAQYDPLSLGVILGVSVGGVASCEPHFMGFFEEGYISNPLAVPISMTNAPASNLSIHCGFGGPLLTIDGACASAAHAIGYAFNMIRFGLLPVVLTGGVDTPITPAIVHGWSSLRALSERNDTPTEACRPFSRDRDGIVLGEGAGIFIMESEDSALHRGARILAEVTGYAATSDGHHLTQPSLRGISEAMRLALVDADLAPEQIDYINAHATATQWNDKTETMAIKNVFGSSAYTVPVVGIKGAIGHSIGASGALELISCVLSIRDGILPPTINVKVPDPECDLDYVTEGARVCDVTHAMSNSFAFGGSNGVLVVSRYIP